MRPYRVRALATLIATLASLRGPGSAHSAPPSIGRYASVNGIRLYYEVLGKGSPLLLLHGGFGDGRQFEKQLPAFKPRHRCIVPDSRAQGRSSDGPGPVTYHQMAEDMTALLDQLHVRRVDIMGWSDGGVIGLDLAMHHPERVRRVVTFGANFRADGLNQPDIDWIASATAESLGSDVKQAYQKQNPQPEHFETAMNKVIAMWRTQPQWTPDQLRAIRARVLVGAGEHDVVRRDHSEALAHAIPKAELWVVPGASHSVMMERPDLVNSKVLEFLERK
ncbi:MAG: alpha/beta hydrolase [Candidatus Eisenbacteria bacterium]